MQPLNWNKQRLGFSLIELLIYFAIFSLLLSLVIRFLFDIKNLQLESQAFINLNRAGQLILLEIQREIRNAQTIDFPQRGESSDDLSLNNGQIIYSRNEEGIIEKNDDSETWPIHSSKIFVEDLIFTRGLNLNQKENIKIEMKLKSRPLLEAKREKFLDLQTTISLR